MITVNIYRGLELILAAKPNDNSNVKQTIMGDNLLTLQFYLDRMIDFRIGDFTDLFGNRYYMHPTKMPVVTKDSKYGYQYDVQMMASQYLLQNAQYLFLGSDNSLKESQFSLNGTANDFIDLLILNANRLGIKWKKGGVIASEYKNLTFNGVDCLSALGSLADAFETEWFVDGTTINLAKKLNPRPYSFKYGKNKGVYDIKRQPADNTSIVTRLYVYGGTQNIPTTYRGGASRLLLPAIQNPSLVSDVTYTVKNNGNGTESITFFWTRPTDPSITKTTINLRNTTTANATYTVFTALITGGDQATAFVTVPNGIYELYFETFTGGAGVYLSAGVTPTIIVGTTSLNYPVLPGSDQPFIQYNVDLYGVIEQTLTFDDIYPHRTGKVTSVDATNPFIFRDTTLDFDINAQLIPGTSAKVIFNTGQLAGYTFEIKDGGYNNSLKQITILKNKDEKTLDIPSSLIRPGIGDEYVLVDIIMPQKYIDNAEAKLLAKAQDYLNTYSAPVYSYSIDCDPKYFRMYKINLAYGDVVKITDTELGINRSIRILSVTKRLDDEYNYTVELGEAVSQGLIQQIQNSISGNSSDINNINSTLQNNKLLAGTNVGNFTIEQGTAFIPDIETAADVSAMKLLYIDPKGKVWKQ